MGVSFPSLRVASKPLEVLKREFDESGNRGDYVGDLLVEFYKYVDTNPSEHRVSGLLLKIDSLFLHAEERGVDLTSQRRVYLGLLQEYKLREDGIKSAAGDNGE